MDSLNLHFSRDVLPVAWLLGSSWHPYSYGLWLSRNAMKNAEMMDASIVQISGCSAAGTGLCMLSCSRINHDPSKWAIFVWWKAGGSGKIHKIMGFRTARNKVIGLLCSHELQGLLETGNLKILQLYRIRLLENKSKGISFSSKKSF